MRILTAAVGTIAFVALAVAAVIPRVEARQQSPVFRGAAVLVPIDLRVLDRNGQPVTNVTAADVRILEDGVPQEIRHFAAQPLMPESGQGSALAPRLRALTANVLTQRRRVFLIVMGRGRLQAPAMGVDAVLHFVRERLLPQDEVAVLAYDRATPFTTDHQQIVRVLERFGRRHEGIEQALKERFSGLAAIYGSKQVPPAIQREIDAIFGDPTRELAPAVVPTVDHIDADLTRTALNTLSDPGVASRRFDEFVSTNRQTMQDVGNLYTGVEYLRRLEGEKHLIFVTELGLALPSLDNDKSLAAFASDARVAIDTIQTGGVPASAASDGTSSTSVTTPQPMSSQRQTLAISSLRTISELTGGSASLYAYAEDAIERINATTRFGYLVGYSPTNTNWDGRFRRVSISVARPDVTVLYRHGYYGRDEISPFDSRQFVTASRLSAAANFRRDIRDIKIELKAGAGNGGSAAHVAVDITVDATRLRFADSVAGHVSTLAIALVCFDSKQRVVGQSAHELRLPFDDAAYHLVLKQGLPHHEEVPVTARAWSAKVVVYDFVADLVGTATAPVK